MSYRKKIYFISTVLLAFLLFTPLIGAPTLVIKNYNKAVSFKDKKVVLIQKGDNPRYKDSGFDDSAWKRVMLPSTWNEIYPGWWGITWYRLHIRFPADPPVRSPGIRLGLICDADEVYFNGLKVGGYGSMTDSREHAYDRVRIYEIPESQIKPGRDNVVAVRVRGFKNNSNGPYRGKFKLASFQKLQKELLAGEFINVLFVVIYISVSIYFGIIFISRVSGREYIYFSLYTLFSGIYFFLRTQIKYMLIENFFVLKRIEYLVLLFLFLFLLEFTISYFKEKHNFLHYAYIGLTLVCAGIVLATSNITIWQWVLFNIVHPSWIIPVGYLLYILIRNRKRRDARYLLIAFSILMVTMFNDIFVSRMYYDFIRLSNYGFMVLILSISVIARDRYEKIYSSKDSPKKRRGITPEARKKLEEALVYIKENYSRDISRESLAANLDLNPDYFGKIFKIFTGKKIGQYINELRIERAAELILHGKESITDIAYSVGFESMSTFYRLFQKLIGKTPLQYKEMHEKDGGG